jgi:hypothetical protein
MLQDLFVEQIKRTTPGANSEWAIPFMLKNATSIKKVRVIVSLQQAVMSMLCISATVLSSINACLYITNFTILHMYAKCNKYT